MKLPLIAGKASSKSKKLRCLGPSSKHLKRFLFLFALAMIAPTASAKPVRKKNAKPLVARARKQTRHRRGAKKAAYPQSLHPKQAPAMPPSVNPEPAVQLDDINDQVSDSEYLGAIMAQVYAQAQDQPDEDMDLVEQDSMLYECVKCGAAMAGDQSYCYQIVKKVDGNETYCNGVRKGAVPLQPGISTWGELAGFNFALGDDEERCGNCRCIKKKDKDCVPCNAKDKTLVPPKRDDQEAPAAAAAAPSIGPNGFTFSGSSNQGPSTAPTEFPSFNLPCSASIAAAVGYGSSKPNGSSGGDSNNRNQNGNHRSEGINHEFAGWNHVPSRVEEEEEEEDADDNHSPLDLVEIPSANELNAGDLIFLFIQQEWHLVEFSRATRSGIHYHGNGDIEGGCRDLSHFRKRRGH